MSVPTPPPAAPPADHTLSRPDMTREIYTYTADWTIYGMAWSCHPQFSQRYRIAIASFIEDYKNKIQVFMVFTCLSFFTHWVFRLLSSMTQKSFKFCLRHLIRTLRRRSSGIPRHQEIKICLPPQATSCASGKYKRMAKWQKKLC